MEVEISDRRDLTQLLRAAADGDSSAADEMLPLVYGELRRLAQSYLSSERPDHTLQATALVHEAYLRLTNLSHTDVNDRAHFFAIAAMAMRRILVDHARRKNSGRRGGEHVIAPLDDEATLVASSSGPRPDYVALDQALRRLSSVAPEKARVVELRFFAGLTTDEIASVVDLAPRTVRRYWQYARAWLHRELAA